MTDVATTYVRIRPNTAGFQAEAEGELSGLGSKLSKALVLTIGVAGVGEAVKSVAEAATAHQAAVNQTETAVKAAGASWKVYGETVEEALDEQSKATGFSFDQLYRSFLKIETQVKDTPKAFQDLALAENIARGAHIQLAQAATVVTKAEGGNYTSFQRLGIILPKYTGNVDALKQKLTDIQRVQTADTEAKAKNYDGTIKLTAAQLALSKDSPLQLKNLSDQIKSQEASAAALDKTQSSATALAAAQQRFGGQAKAYADSSAGEIDRFRSSLEIAEVSLGQKLLPYLAEAAQAGAKWADELASSKGVAQAVGSAANDVAGGIEAIVSAIQAGEPAFKLLADIIGVVGPGPILATYAAYKTLTISVAAAGKATGIYAGLVKAGTVATSESAVASSADSAALVSEAAAAEDAAAAQLTLFRATELDVGAQQSLFDASQLASSGLDEVTASSVAASAARDTQGVSKLGLAADGLTAALTGPTAAVAALALFSGAIYYASSQETQAEKNLNDLADTYTRLNTAIAAGTSGTKQAKADLAELVAQYAVLSAAAKAPTAVDFGGHGGIIPKDASDQVAQYVQSLDQLIAKDKNLTAAQVLQIQGLQNFAEATGKVPTTHTTKLILDDAQAYQGLAEFIAKLNSDTAALRAVTSGKSPLATPGSAVLGGLAPQKQVPLADFDKNARGTIAQTNLDKPISELAKKNAATYSTAFSQSIDVSSIASALSDAISQARQNVTSSASDLANDVGSVLDARLAATEKTLDATQTRLQAQISARSAAQTARDNQGTASDAASKLAELQSVLGTGPLTADQASQLRDAQNAVLDAQDSIATATDQAQSDAIDKRKTALEATETLEKTAATRRLADLADELNKGLISESSYVGKVRAELAKYGTSYKSAGSLLGKAFADGFADSLSGTAKQAAALLGVGQAKLKATTTRAAVVNPVQLEAAAVEAIVQQIAGSSGKFTLDKTGTLPKGVTIASLISGASSSRADAAYRAKTGKDTSTALEYAGQTRDHTKDAAAALKKIAAQGLTVNLTVDGKKQKRKVAEATHS